MTGKFSRSKGKRGELEVRSILGDDFKRTGYHGKGAPDVSSSWCIVSVKNEAVPISLKKALSELIALEAEKPELNHYVAVKVNHHYLMIQRIEQFREDRC